MVGVVFCFGRCVGRGQFLLPNCRYFPAKLQIDESISIADLFDGQTLHATAVADNRSTDRSIIFMRSANGSDFT
jgi:hypothetical protein